MRLRVAIGVIVVLFLLGITVLVQQRARAEHIRVALFQAQAAAQDENKPSEAAPAAIGVVAPSTTPAAASSAAAPVAAPTFVEAVVTGPVAQPPGGPGGGAPGSAQVPVALPGGAGRAIVQVTAPMFHGGWSAGPGTSPYGVSWPSNDPEMNELASQDQQLEQEVQSLVRQLADSDDDKAKSDLKDKLAATLDKQFDAQQKLRQLEISRIEARVKKLQDLVRKRTESRRKIIDNRMEQLLNDAEGLGWSTSTGTGTHGVVRANPSLFAPRQPGALPTPQVTTASPRVQ